MDLVFKLVDKLSVTTEVYEELSRSKSLIKPLANEKEYKERITELYKNEELRHEMGKI